MDYHLELTIWGQSFVETFLRVSLPSLLWPGNLPALTHSSNCRLSLYTTPEDEARMKNDPSFTELERLLPITFLYLHDIPPSSYELHQAFSCMDHFCASPESRGRGLIFLCPDCIYSNGSLANIERYANAGKRIVLVSGLRTDKAGMYQTLEQGPLTGDFAPMSPRDLVRACLPNLHPQQEQRFWNGPRILTDDFALLCWRVNEQGLLIRAFCLHPLLIVPTEAYHGLPLKHAIDYVYPPLLHPRPEEVHIVRDSDEIFIVELSERDSFAGLPSRSGRMDAAEVAGWAEKTWGYFHLSQAKHVIKVHHAELTDEWVEAERASDAAIEEIFSCLGEPQAVPRPVSSDRLSILIPDELSPEAFEQTLLLTSEQLRAGDEIAVPANILSAESKKQLQHIAIKRPHLNIKTLESIEPIAVLQEFVAHASGDYVAIFPAGSFPMTQAFEKTLNLFRWYPDAAICYSDPVTIDSRGYLLHQHLPWKDVGEHGIAFDSFLSPLHFAERLQGSFFDYSCVVKRSSLLEESVLLKELDWFTWPFAVLTAAFRHGACFIPQPLFALHDEGLSMRMRQRSRYSRKAILLRVIECLRHPQTRQVHACFSLSGIIAKFKIPFDELAYSKPGLYDKEIMADTINLCSVNRSDEVVDETEEDPGITDEEEATEDSAVAESKKVQKRAAQRKRIKKLGFNPLLQRQLERYQAEYEQACQAEDYLRIARLLSKIRDQFPDVIELHFDAGRIAQDCSDSLSRNPRVANNWLALGELTLMLGQHPVALSCFETAGRLDPEITEIAKKIETLRWHVKQMARHPKSSPAKISTDRR